ncbi:MAG: rRNA (guanine527-N7)-methyltransferase [Sphingomonadales bacterium]|jgi:16S rRNA (guanine527-N7)-methyltransferase|nr:rRNA (guanine527-N7)-methyltransferase [Sphingomonadales bacterium]
MTESEARGALDVPRETLERLDRFVAFLAEENERQNLVSRGSLEHLWTRHVYDSAQLTRFAPAEATEWLDLGSGAGFPGLIVALLHPARVTLVEARKLRAEFLRRAANALEVADKVEVVCAKVESLAPRAFDVISARAFAPLGRLLALGAPFSDARTIWILPKGRNAKSELEAARSSWQGDFSLEPSLTDAEAGIVVARGVSRRKPKGKR